MADRQSPVDDDALFSGFMLGLLVGCLVAILKAPRIRLRSRRPAVPERPASSEDAVHPASEAPLLIDPADVSAAEGKAAARRRRSELGLHG